MSAAAAHSVHIQVFNICRQLTNDMETTKAALESERKIQMLQTEAISALWKQMSALQPSTGQSSSVNMTSLSADNAEVVKELAKTCTVLQNQVRFLRVGCFYKNHKILVFFPDSATAEFYAGHHQSDDGVQSGSLSKSATHRERNSDSNGNRGGAHPSSK